MSLKPVYTSEISLNLVRITWYMHAGNVETTS